MTHEVKHYERDAILLLFFDSEFIIPASGRQRKQIRILFIFRRMKLLFVCRQLNLLMLICNQFIVLLSARDFVRHRSRGPSWSFTILLHRYQTCNTRGSENLLGILTITAEYNFHFKILISNTNNFNFCTTRVITIIELFFYYCLQLIIKITVKIKVNINSWLLFIQWSTGKITNSLYLPPQLIVS